MTAAGALAPLLAEPCVTAAARARSVARRSASDGRQQRAAGGAGQAAVRHRFAAFAALDRPVRHPRTSAVTGPAARSPRRWQTNDGRASHPVGGPMTPRTSSVRGRRPWSRPPPARRTRPPSARVRRSRSRRTGRPRQARGWRPNRRPGRCRPRSRRRPPRPSMAPGRRRGPASGARSARRSPGDGGGTPGPRDAGRPRCPRRSRVIRRAAIAPSISPTIQARTSTTSTSGEERTMRTAIDTDASERIGQLEVGRPDDPHRRPPEGQHQRDVGEDPGRHDPDRDPRAAGRRAGRRPVVGRDPGDDPGSLGLECGCRPAAEDQPAEDDDDGADGHRDEGRRDRSQRERRDPRRQHVAEADRRRQHDDRDRDEEEAAAEQERGQCQRPGGRGRERHEQRTGQRRPAVHGAGLADAPAPGVARPGARTWSRWSADWTRAISDAVASRSRRRGTPPAPARSGGWRTRSGRPRRSAARRPASARRGHRAGTS